MTPAQRNRLNLKDAMRYMSVTDIRDAANNSSLPAWARQMYAEEFARWEDALVKAEIDAQNAHERRQLAGGR